MNRSWGFIGIGATILSFGCSLGNAVEVARHSNPSKTIDAVIAERDAGATTSTAVEVYLVPSGQATSNEPVFRADKFEGFSIEWRDSLTLLIRADEARVFLKKTLVTVQAAGVQNAVEVRHDIDKETEPDTGVGMRALSCIDGWPDAQAPLKALAGELGSTRRFRSRTGNIDGLAGSSGDLIEAVVYSPDESRGTMFLLRQRANGSISILPKYYALHRRAEGWSVGDDGADGAGAAIGKVATQMASAPYELMPTLPGTRCPVER